MLNELAVDLTPPGGIPGPVVALGIGVLVVLALLMLFGRGGGKKR